MTDKPFKIMGELVKSDADLTQVTDPFDEVEVQSEIAPIQFSDLPVEALESMNAGGEYSDQLMTYVNALPKQRRDEFVGLLYMYLNGTDADRISAHKSGTRVNVLKGDDYHIGHLGIERNSKFGAWSTGLGKIHIPLIHSGFYIRINRPSMQEYVNLRKKIALEDTYIARSTSGISTMLNNSIAKEHVLEFVRRHMTLTDLEDGTTKDKAISLILDRDIPTILNFILLSFYPNGHPFSLECNSSKLGIVKEDGSKCTHVKKGLINFNNIWTINSDMLDDNSRKFLNIKNIKRKVSDVLEYQSKVSKRDNQFTIGSIVFEFKLATTVDKATAFRQWIQDVIEAIDDAVLSKISIEARQDMINTNLALAHLRHYLPYIKSVTKIGDNDTAETVEIDNIEQVSEDIIDLLTELSDDESQKDFIEAIDKFIGNNTLVDIGFTNRACTECGTHYGNDPDSYLIPLDIETLFFDILDTRQSWHQVRNIR